MKSIEKIKELLASIEDDVIKLEKGMKAPGARVRKVLMTISRVCKEGRKEVMDIKHGNTPEPDNDIPDINEPQDNSEPETPSEE